MASSTKIECDDCGSRFRMATERVLRNPDLTCPECGSDIEIEESSDSDEEDSEDDDPSFFTGGIFTIGSFLLPFLG